jgi:GWxTD domain-containing protein
MAQFKSPKSGPYIETYLNIIGNTVEFRRNIDGNFQSKVEILYLFKQNNEIKAFEKYTLESPLLSDSLFSYPNYTDVQRIAIDNGIYNFEIKIRDLYDTSNVFSYKDIITISMDKKYQFSDIELIKSYKETEQENILSKNGLDIIPYVSSFFPNNIDTIIFYSELYNMAKKEDFLLQYYIESQSKEEILNNYIRHKKINANEVTPIINSFDISKLPTGNYNLVLNLKNRENKLLCQRKFFFQRYNSKVIKPTDTVKLTSVGLVELTDITRVAVMKDYIKSIFPILNQRELSKANNVLRSDDIELMKNFFNNYWQSNSTNPEQDWSIYKQNVDRVNRSYSSQIKRGYESDRGRVFLKYGQPNDINRSAHEPGSYPYEIWHYFEINGETNKKFVFYNPEIAGDDYTLLHSDVTGEKSNPYWQKELSRRTSTSPNDIDNYSSDPQYGNRSRDLYNR